MATLAQIRQQYPQYNSLSDQQLSDALYNKFYAGKISRDQFNAKLGMTTSSGPPAGAVPGSQAYAQWAIQQAKAGVPLPQVSPAPPAAQQPNLANSTLATINGLTGSVPFLNQTSDAILAGGQTLGDIATKGSGDFGAHYNAIQDERQQVAQAAPVANTLGGIGGTIGGAGLIGAVPAGAEALGMAGSFGKQLVNSMLSTGAYQGAQGLSNGHLGMKLMGDIGAGTSAGALGSLFGQSVNKVGEGLSNALTNRAQDQLIDSATQGSNLSADDVKKAGGALFDQAFPEGQIPMVTDTAYMKFLSGIQQAVQKYRPNTANDPQATGLLQHMMELGDDANTPGTAIDLQDLHLARQLAQKVAQSPSGRDSAIGSIVTSKLDDFIGSLGPNDILGGGDPTANAQALQAGISTWAKARKMDILEDAIQKAQGYKSGYENGLKSTFSNLMKNDDFNRFTPAEQAAITQVAKGSAGQNIASLIGSLGITTGGKFGAKNVLGAGIGTGGLTAALSPFIGPAALPVAAAATTTAGMIGRRLATDAAQQGANRAVQTVGQGGIAAAPQVGSWLSGAGTPLGLALRPGALALGQALLGSQ